MELRHLPTHRDRLLWPKLSIGPKNKNSILGVLNYEVRHFRSLVASSRAPSHCRPIPLRIDNRRAEAFYDLSDVDRGH